MEIKKLKPAPGKIIHNPATLKDLPADGARVEMSSYWVRALSYGDVLIVADDQSYKEEESKPESDKESVKSKRNKGVTVL